MYLKKIQVRPPSPEIAEILPLYLENRLKEISVLKEAAQNQDYDVLLAIAHNIKGTAKVYGMQHLGELADDFNRAAERKDAEGVSKAVSAYLDYLALVELT